MNRRNFTRVGAMVLAAAAVGCGGRVEGVSASDEGSANAEATFGQQARAYFGVTNELATHGRPATVKFDLVAGARVELEVVTRDASPLEFELRRVRRDGTKELLEHVHVTSGFHLGTFEASSPNTYELYFPESAQAYQTIIVHLGCTDSGSGRCAPAGQPGESCSDANPCDVGLACSAPKGVYLAFGTCGAPPPPSPR